MMLVFESLSKSETLLPQQNVALKFDVKIGSCNITFMSQLILKVKVYTQVSEGYMFITSSGGNGNQGQPGADGRKGADKIDTV